MKTLFTICFAFIYLNVSAQNSTILKDKVYMFESPNSMSKQIYVASAGDTVELISQAGDFWKAKVKGNTGYIFYVIPKPYDFPAYVKVGILEGDLVHLLGRPNKINKTEGAYGTHEQWVYIKPNGDEYYYFDDGKLTSWQTTQ